MTYWHEIDSPVGPLMLVGTARALARTHFQAGPQALRPGKGWQPYADAFVQVQAQLMEYFCGARRSFDLVEHTRLSRLVNPSITQQPEIAAGHRGRRPQFVRKHAEHRRNVHVSQ